MISTLSGRPLKRKHTKSFDKNFILFKEADEMWLEGAKVLIGWVFKILNGVKIWPSNVSGLFISWIIVHHLIYNSRYLKYAYFHIWMRFRILVIVSMIQSLHHCKQLLARNKTAGCNWENGYSKRNWVRLKIDSGRDPRTIVCSDYDTV